MRLNLKSTASSYTSYFASRVTYSPKVSFVGDHPSKEATAAG